MSSPQALHGPSRFQSVSFLLIFLAASHYSFSEPQKNKTNIKNFGQTNENYYRGGQPTEAQFFALKQMGIKTVIDLQKDGVDQEADWVRNAGMQFFKIPLYSTRPATAEQTEYFLKLVNDPSNWPVYVHCAGGRHRTGEMTAIYRITQDSWDADRAYREMKEYGYYSFPNHGSLKRYVYDYYSSYRTAQKKETPVPVPVPVPVLQPLQTEEPVSSVN